MKGYAFLKYLKEMSGADSSSRGEAVEQHISSSTESQGKMCVTKHIRGNKVTLSRF